MHDLILEEDFVGLPDEPQHKWLLLEKLGHRRLLEILAGDYKVVITTMQDQYMHVVATLAKTYEVDGIALQTDASTEARYAKFRLAVSRAQVLIWSTSPATFPLGRVALNAEIRTAILDLTSEIENKINCLDDTDRRKASYHKRLEDFRREINQPKTRIGAALTSLAQISTIVAMTTTSLSQGPDAFATIQKLLGAEFLTETGSEIVLIESEKQLLLPSPPARIEGPKNTGK
jgi:hypothetical protein